MSDGDFQIPSEFDHVIGMAEEAYADMINYEKQMSMTGVEKIAQERLEQKTKHRRSVKSDYELNPDFQLVDGAIKLLQGGYSPNPDGWDYKIWEKMTLKSDEERLIIAGALIAAEIDRLNFKE